MPGTSSPSPLSTREVDSTRCHCDIPDTNTQRCLSCVSPFFLNLKEFKALTLSRRVPITIWVLYNTNQEGMKVF